MSQPNDSNAVIREIRREMVRSQESLNRAKLRRKWTEFDPNQAFSAYGNSALIPMGLLTPLPVPSIPRTDFSTLPKRESDEPIKGWRVVWVNLETGRISARVHREAQLQYGKVMVAECHKETRAHELCPKWMEHSCGFYAHAESYQCSGYETFRIFAPQPPLLLARVEVELSGTVLHLLNGYRASEEMLVGDIDFSQSSDNKAAFLQIHMDDKINLPYSLVEKLQAPIVWINGKRYS